MPDNCSPVMKEKILMEEGESLLKHIRDEDYLILLDLKGKEMTSEEFAGCLNDKMLTGTNHFYFMIGGPCGNGENIRKRANLRISFGKMTLTHQMARLILSEQIYRAMKIIHNQHYHL